LHKTSANTQNSVCPIDRQWRKLFVQHQDILSAVARILTDGPCSPAAILFNAEMNLKSREVSAEFQYRYSIRAVVLAALVMPSSEDCPAEPELSDCCTADLAHFEHRIQALPYRERCVIFLRDVLEYSRRETALVLSASDAQVDDLHYFGRSRFLLQDLVAFDRVKRYFAANSPLPCSQATSTALLVSA
jgi:hypothetical protein